MEFLNMDIKLFHVCVMFIGVMLWDFIEEVLRNAKSSDRRNKH